MAQFSQHGNTAHTADMSQSRLICTKLRLISEGGKHKVCRDKEKTKYLIYMIVL